VTQGGESLMLHQQL